MSLKESISRTLKRLNLQGIMMQFPFFGKGLYDGLSAEFDRVNDFKNKIKVSVVPNSNMDPDTIDDYEDRYGIESITDGSDSVRIQRIIARAAMDGSGGPDWLENQIRNAGFDLYVIVNTPDAEESSPQFGPFQFNDVQFGSLVSYIDPRNIDGEIIASSPVNEIGGLYDQFGDYQFNDIQFGSIIEGTSYPRPRQFAIPSDPNRWAYVFFVSPFEDRLAGPSELAQLTEQELRFLRNLILKDKFTRNWCILQAEAI